MIFYVVEIIFLILVIIVCIFLLIYYIKDEKNFKEVSDNYLKEIGKSYSKSEFENKMFEIYVNIINGIKYSDYSFLKDAVSDKVYNQILLSIKENQDRQQSDEIKDIKKKFSKLISFQTINDLEIAKVWIKYSDIEYKKSTKATTNVVNSQFEEEVIISGNKDKVITHEYILTFVKEKTKTEEIICPSCAYQTNMLTSSNCINCGSEIIPKKMHWVYVEKVDMNNKEKKVTVK